MPKGVIGMADIIALALNTKTTFNKTLMAYKPRWTRTAELIPVTGLDIQLPWMDIFPSMVEWNGDKIHKLLKVYESTLHVKEWEVTIDINRKYIETDQVGLFLPRIRGAAESAAKWPDQRVNAVKNAAFATLGWDGQYHYDTDHEVAGASVSNLLTAPLSGASNALAAASYGAARAAMMGFKDNEGESLELVGNLLEVPPALETHANIIAYQEKFSDDTPNPYKGTCEVLVNPGLTSTTAWFLHCVNASIMPYVFLQRKAPNYVQITDPQAQQVFERADFSFGAESSGIGGYGPWQLSVGSTGLG